MLACTVSDYSSLYYDSGNVGTSAAGADDVWCHGVANMANCGSRASLIGGSREGVRGWCVGAFHSSRCSANGRRRAVMQRRLPSFFTLLLRFLPCSLSSLLSSFILCITSSLSVVLTSASRRLGYGATQPQERALKRCALNTRHWATT